MIPNQNNVLQVPNTSLKIRKQPARKDNVISIRADGARPLTYQWLLGRKKLCDDDDQDYDGYATDKLVIKDKNFLLSGGVFKCQVKDKFDNCAIESDEFGKRYINVCVCVRDAANDSCFEQISLKMCSEKLLNWKHQKS